MSLLVSDAAALALIGHDVAQLSDHDLSRNTPCAGWTVAALIEHMTERHEAVAATALPSTPATGEPRDDFALTSARWTCTMEQSDDTLELPGLGSMAREKVLAVHLVDMLAHRWDTAVAVGRDCQVPDRLLAVALPIARSITSEDSPLTGPGRAYQPRQDTSRARTDLEVIVALLGRNPRWVP